MLVPLLLGAGTTMAGAAPATPAIVVPTFRSEPVGVDADDPAIWHRNGLVRIVGTDKDEEKGGLAVFDRDGRTVQRIDGLKRPNNGDVEGDLYVCTERKANRLRIFRFDRAGKLADVTGETATVEEPMGISLYRRPKDGALFAVVSPKTGPADGYLAWYRLMPRGDRVDAKLVTRAGAYSGRKEIESILVDDERNVVWYSDEGFGSRAVPADPDGPAFGRPIAFLNSVGWGGDHEGIALVKNGEGGWLIFTDQRPNASLYTVRDRTFPFRVRGVFTLNADETDGIDATGENLGKGYESGLVVAMNSGGRNFVGAPWAAILRALRP